MFGSSVGFQRIGRFQGTYFVDRELLPPVGNAVEKLVDLFRYLLLVVRRRILPDVSTKC